MTTEEEVRQKINSLPPEFRLDFVRVQKCVLPLLKKAQKMDKAQAFSQLLEALPTSILELMARSLSFPEDSPEAKVGDEGVFWFCVAVRSALYGSKDGSFPATEPEEDVVNRVTPFLICELIRRKGCFKGMKLPKDPYSDNDDFLLRGPDLHKVEQTRQYLKRVGILSPMFLHPDVVMRIAEQTNSKWVAPTNKGRST